MIMDKKLKEKEILKEIVRSQIAETCGKQVQILKEGKDTLKQKRVVRSRRVEESKSMRVRRDSSLSASIRGSFFISVIFHFCLFLL